MNLKQLEAFTMVVELGSLTRTSKVAGIPQSLLSRHIASLEREWNDRLLLRTGRGVVLTEFGRRMQPEVAHLLQQMRHLESVAKDAAGAVSGIVHIGLFPSVSRRLLPVLLADLRVRAPAVRLHVTEGFSGSLDEQLASGRIDLMVMNRYGWTGGRDEDVLSSADTYLVGRPGHPLLADASVPFRRLDGVPLVLPPLPNGLRSIFDRHARRLDITIDVVLEVETLATMKTIAAAGEALTVLPLIAIEDEVAGGQLAASKIVRPGIERTITLSLSRQRPLSRAARLVASRVREATMQLLAPARRTGADSLPVSR
ncbi:MAG: LysR family transcriptional regulator [Lautropia sp.]